MPTKPSRTLETFENPHPERDYVIEITMPEFTCLCPKTGQPDFATLYLEYIADRKCVELKSLKLYVWSYRNEGAFHEAVTNQILSDLVAATDPRYMRLRAEFNVRGGIYTAVVVEHTKPGWGAQHPAPLGAAVPAAPTPTRAPALAAEGKQPARTAGERFRMLPRARSDAADSQPAEAEPEPASLTKATSRPAPSRHTDPADSLFIGVDVGTSACRVVAIDGSGRQLAQASAPVAPPMQNDDQVTQDANVWWQALVGALDTLAKGIDGTRVRALAVDATSATILLADKRGAPLTPGLMYNDSRARVQADKIVEIAGARSGAHGATGSLAKLLWLCDCGLHTKAAHCLHQADWLVGRLTGVWGVSDFNNALKLGYDCEALQWSQWLSQIGIEGLLPEVKAPGTPIGPLAAELAKRWGFSQANVVAGTTDGVASFVAAGASALADGVTSLGSTLVIKLLSDKAVFSREHGIYSHRLGERWLVGGASNSGGAALLQYFDVAQMRDMTPLLDPDNPTGLDYYPLPRIGERFPINDPQLAPRTEPLPGDSVTFFQAMLEGIARIEARGYALLAQLGAPKAKVVTTTGGGAQNAAWERIRARMLGVTMRTARSQLPAYGTALLAAGLHEAGSKKSVAAG